MTRRLRTEDGFTVVMAMFVLLVGLLFATAAIGQALSTESAVRRDGASKQALQAARAGIEASRYRMTALAEGTMSPDGDPLCPIPDGNGHVTFEPPDISAGGTTWCESGDELVGAGESSTTWISTDREPDLHMTDRRDIVSRGIARDGRRRVRTSWMIFDIRRIFMDYAVFSRETLNLANQADIGAPDVQGNARSNGDINLNHPQTRIYGNATPGNDDEVNVKGQVTGSTEPADEDLVLPPVDLTEARLANDNAALCGGTCPADLRITLSDTRTIVGNTYRVCALTLSGTGNPTITFKAADPTQPIRIFVETPELCGGTGGSVFEVGQKPTIVVLNQQFPSLQILIAGSTSIPTTAFINNNNSSPSLPITLYGPNTDVSVDNHSTIDGGIAARKVTLSNNTKIVQFSRPPQLDLEIQPEISGGEFVECTGADPESGSPLEGC